MGTSTSRVTTPRRKAYEEAWYDAHREETLTKCREYRAKHREQIRAYHKVYYKNHRDEVLLRGKIDRLTHPEKQAARHKAYYEKNREATSAYQKAYHAKQKIEVITAYGGRCVCCGESRIEFLTLDHLNGGGRKHRRNPGATHFYSYLKRNGFPRDLGLQVMCMNCNWAKYAYGRCPHEDEKVES